MSKRRGSRNPRLQPVPSQPVIADKHRILFTHNDLDGAVCAVLFKKCYQNSDIFFCNYTEGFDYEEINNCVTNVLSQVPPDTNVLIADISVSPELATGLNDRGYVGLLDHHANLDYLQQYSWAQITPKKCGAMLVYEMLSKGFHLEDYYPLVKLTNLWDRWRKNDVEFEKAKILNRLFQLMGRDDFIQRMFHSPIPEPLEVEATALRWKFLEMSRYLQESVPRCQMFQDEQGFTFAIVLADQYISELGNYLLTIEDKLEYTMVLDLRHTTGHLRGRGNRNLAELAKSIVVNGRRGGGHPQSAGFPIQGFNFYEFLGIDIEVRYEGGERTDEEVDDANSSEEATGREDGAGLTLCEAPDKSGHTDGACVTGQDDKAGTGGEDSETVGPD